MTRSLVFALLCFPFFSFADVISTGSAQADTTLQWITSAVTVFSILANFTNTTTDNKVVRVASVLIHIFAGNWKPLKGAWTGAAGFALAVLIGCALLAPNSALAASVKLTCDAPTTRESGAVLDPAEVAGYSFYLDGKLIGSGNACTFIYPVPEGVALTAANTFGVTATDKSAPPLTSAPGTAASPITSTPKTAPAKPGNVKTFPF
jgi:hypothetical protein